jgi:hypothetical protein
VREPVHMQGRPHQRPRRHTVWTCGSPGDSGSSCR